MWIVFIVISVGGGTATEEDIELIARLFGSIGKVWKAEEKLFDAITGLRYVNTQNFMNLELKCV